MTLTCIFFFFLLYSFKPHLCSSNFINYWNDIFLFPVLEPEEFLSMMIIFGGDSDPCFNCCSGQVSWFGVFPKKKGKGKVFPKKGKQPWLSQCCSPPHHCYAAPSTSDVSWFYFGQTPWNLKICLQFVLLCWVRGYCCNLCYHREI